MREVCYGKSKEISIHLMLLFISKGNPIWDEFNIFQYISCYCLSSSFLTAKSICLYFNTSHVTVYQQSHTITPHGIQISIHLMLLFIRKRISKNTEQEEFQYISCYCLSNQDHLHVYPLPHFNTSHVTVYRIS